MKTIIGAVITFLTSAMLVFLPNGLSVETPPENLVRVVYFLPCDRQSQPGIDAKLGTLIKKVQQSYAEVMEKHRFGRKTYRIETDGLKTLDFAKCPFFNGIHKVDDTQGIATELTSR